MDTIIIKDVSKSYGKIKAVEDLNFTVKEGDIYGFIGPNGAGKSTTIRMILNFLKIDKGEISVFGFSPSKDDVKIKQNTGYVPSDTFMYNDLKVSELFQFTESFYKINANEKIKKLVEILDIDVNKKFEQLSFGNRKKVSIACALLHSPKLLILDEPSNGLDPVIRINLYDLLKEENKKGTTILFSSHVLHEVQKFCTKIGLIKEGKIIREETAEEFAKIGYSQVKIETNNTFDFEKINGISNLIKQNNTYQFLYSGSSNDLISILNKLDIISVIIDEPDPESVFMHYFK